MSKGPTSFRLSSEGKDLLEKLAEKWGVNRTAMLEILIRERAKKEGVK